MAFTWTETITKGITKIKGSHIRELQTNVDLVHNNLGTSNLATGGTNAATNSAYNYSVSSNVYTGATNTATGGSNYYTTSGSSGSSNAYTNNTYCVTTGSFNYYTNSINTP